MATRFFSRSLLAPTKQTLTSIFSSRSFISLSLSKPPQSLSSTASTFSLFRLRPLVAFAGRQNSFASSVRCFATRRTASSLNDPQPNWSNRPPKETILLDGCDFEHWLVVMEKPEGDPTRDEIIDSYIKTLAQVVGSEEEARMKIYSVSTRCYYAFGALVSEELSYKLKELPRVRWVLPDSYLDVKNKDYGGEPFINGQAVPYDPKYHAEWERNNARANERNRRNDRPRNHDRSRNFDRRMQMANQNVGGNMGQRGPGGPQNVGPGGPQNMGPTNSYTPPNMVGGAPNRDGMAPPNNFGGMPSHNMGGPASNYMGQQPSNQMGHQPSTQMGQQPSNPMGGQQPSNYMAGQPPPNSMGGMQHNMGGMANTAQNFQYESPPTGGGTSYQSGPGPNQYNYPPNMAGGNPYQNQNVPGRDVPPPQNYQ